jgi:hypothetical protein
MPFRGMTNFREKNISKYAVVLLTGNLILASRGSGPIELVGRIEAEVAENVLPNLEIISPRIV